MACPDRTFTPAEDAGFQWECPKCGNLTGTFTGDSCLVCGDNWQCHTCAGYGEVWNPNTEEDFECPRCSGTGEEPTE